MNRDQQFFYDNAGFGYDPKTETAEQGREKCAIALAAAEEQARNTEGWYFEWTPDWDIDDSWMTPAEKRKPHNWEVCQLLDSNDHVLASLSGIVDASTAYRRVVEAELASEVV